jgi:hypothetical protein
MTVALQATSASSGDAAWVPFLSSLTVLADPGSGAAIPVDNSYNVAFVIGGTETNTVADPSAAGQSLAMVAGTVASGSRALTFATAFNAAGNTVLTFDAANEFGFFISISTGGGTFRWQQIALNGATASTP